MSQCLYTMRNRRGVSEFKRPQYFDTARICETRKGSSGRGAVRRMMALGAESLTGLVM
jgi:hypothetical protein